MEMQKKFAIIFALVTGLALAACGNKTADDVKAKAGDAAGAAATAAAGAAAGAVAKAAGGATDPVAAANEGEDPNRKFSAIDTNNDNYVSAEEMEKWLNANPGPFKKK